MISPPPCPICKKPVPLTEASATTFFPFCSERCRQIDLLRWCKGTYQIVEPLTPEHLEAAGDAANLEPEGD